MPKLTTHNSSVADLVTKLLEESSMFYAPKGSTHGRTALRREFARVAEVLLGETPIAAYTRDISLKGVGLVTDRLIPPGLTAVVKIQRFASPDTAKFVAKCVWCKDAGVSGIISGWQFERLY